ncbi:tetratricopeptide repeat protein [Nonomuraea sp. PA05]|uniref:AfsR/SARP family transcriptional regulator n=1 Tax=Nonomuraea sp. PA05 TaxID=2604466 RepID=UPI0011D838EC|nr:BTAD domain-containing putative transcriptional regulator [Nonomuraea sp. PA05]TYB71038.1 tetratricopeptide repeat protein [Nonomuraea sp. PA05]
MMVRVLGPIQLCGIDGRPVRLSGKLRALLAALTFNVNTLVSRERLVEALWDDPPLSAVKNLHSYITQLRRTLPVGARLLTKEVGYLLEAGVEEVDLLQFEEALGAARGHTRQEQLQAADLQFRRALGLWRGKPAEGTWLAGPLLAQVSELNERLAVARLDWAETKLALGRPKEVIEDLRVFIAEQPLNERGWRLLMLAYARSGQRDKALECFRRARSVLVDELGVEPAEELQQLNAAVLGGTVPVLDPASLARRAHPDDDAGESEPASRRAQRRQRALGEGGASVQSVQEERYAEDGPGQGGTAELLARAGRGGGVCQLPPDIADFVGRQGALTAAVDALRPGSAAAALALCVISGQGGVGKSALAVHVAHRMRDEFPDGQLYVNLRGGSVHPIDPEEALGRSLRALGVDSAAVPAGLDERAELYRSILAGGRYLVVLDDAADEGQVRPLLPGTPECGVLVTARHRLTALPAAALIDLPVMPPADSLDLLRHLIGAERAAEAPEDTDRLIRLCGGLPLAMRIAGARLAARPHWAVSQLVTRLSDSRDLLGQLSHGSQGVRASLAVGYQGLTGPARRLFRLLGLLEVPDFAAWVAAALLDRPYTEAEDVVEQLVDVRLLDVTRDDPTGRVRYRFHDLTRVYARERAEAEEPGDERDAALRRAMHVWLALTRRAHVNLCGGDYRRSRGPGPLWSPAESVLDDHVGGDPLGWADAERAGIVAAVRQSAVMGAGELCWELASTAAHLFETRCLHDEWRTTHDIALRHVQAAGDVRGQAVLLNGLGRLYLAQDEVGRCREAFEEAAALFERAGDRHGRALALVNLAELYRMQGRGEEAMVCYEQAAGPLAQAGDRGTEVTVLRGIGRVHFSHGRLELADRYIRRAMQTACTLDKGRACEFSRIVLGEIELARGRHAAAETCFRLAKQRFDAIGFPRGTAYATLGLAMARREQQDLAAAQDLLGQALAVNRELGDHHGEARVLFEQAGVLRRLGRDREAAAMLADVVAICQAIGVPRRHGLALRALGDVHHDVGDTSAALDAWRSALELLDATSSPESAEVATLIERYSAGEKQAPRTLM